MHIPKEHKYMDVPTGYVFDALLLFSTGYPSLPMLMPLRALGNNNKDQANKMSCHQFTRRS